MQKLIFALLFFSFNAFAGQTMNRDVFNIVKNVTFDLEKDNAATSKIDGAVIKVHRFVVQDFNLINAPMTYEKWGFDVTYDKKAICEDAIVLSGQARFVETEQSMKRNGKKVEFYLEVTERVLCGGKIANDFLAGWKKIQDMKKPKCVGRK